MTDFLPGIKERQRRAARRYVALVLLLCGVAVAAAGTDDYKTARLNDQATDAEKEDLLRYSRDAVLANYSAAGVPRGIRLAEVGR